MKPTKFEIICNECGGLSDHIKVQGKESIRCRCCASSEEFNRSGYSTKTTKINKVEKVRHLLSTLKKEDWDRIRDTVVGQMNR